MRFALRASTLAAAVALAGAAPHDDALARIAAANGHAALVHVRATAVRTVEGRTVETTFEQLGTAHLLRRCVAGACGGIWFDGAHRSTFGINDVALPEADGATIGLERTLAAIGSYAFAEPSFRAGGGTVSEAGANRWRVRARDGDELIAVVDAATLAVVRVERSPGTPALAEYGRFVRVAGATFALDRSAPFEPGRLDAATVVAGPLTAPAGPDVRFAGDAPAALAGEPVPVVPCTLAGRRERCLIDSGATPSAVTLPVAEALGLEPRGELEITGLGRFATGFVEAGPLVAGAARIASARFAVVPAAASLPFDVVVGSDLLGKVAVVFDRRAGTARFETPGGPAPGTAVPLTFAAGSPRVAAVLDGDRRSALLDTGDAAVISLGIAAYRDGPQWPVVARGAAVGVAGSDDTLTVQLPNLTVGAVAAGPVRALVRRTQPDVHVGVGLWTRFRLDLDEASGRISFSSY